MLTTLHAGERDWLTAVVAAPLDDLKKLVYADWLEERGDPRAAFLRGYVEAAKSMDPAKLPPADGLPEEWLALIGYRITQLLATTAPALRDAAFRLARPALRLIETKVKEETLPDGVSKLGGRPDLPPGFAWPTGHDCKANSHMSDSDVHAYPDGLAGFLGQINLGEIAHTQAAKVLPPKGLLSFFAYEDYEGEEPCTLGARCFYFPDVTALARTKPPRQLDEANRRMQAQRLSFEETLSLPEYPYSGSGPQDSWRKWGGVIEVDPVHAAAALSQGLWDLSGVTLLGYGHRTNGTDNRMPEWRHLITLTSQGEWYLYLTLEADDLAGLNFDALFIGDLEQV